MFAKKRRAHQYYCEVCATIQLVDRNRKKVLKVHGQHKIVDLFLKLESKHANKSINKYANNIHIYIYIYI